MQHAFSSDQFKLDQCIDFYAVSLLIQVRPLSSDIPSWFAAPLPCHREACWTQPTFSCSNQGPRRPCSQTLPAPIKHSPSPQSHLLPPAICHLQVDSRGKCVCVPNMSPGTWASKPPSHAPAPPTPHHEACHNLHRPQH